MRLAVNSVPAHQDPPAYLTALLNGIMLHHPSRNQDENFYADCIDTNLPTSPSGALDALDKCRLPNHSFHERTAYL